MSATPSAFAAIRAEVRALDQGPRALRGFGVVVGVVVLGVAVWLAWRANGAPSVVAWGLGGAGAALVLGGLLVPGLLKPLHRAWMTLAFALGYGMTRVLLTLTFVLVFLPISAMLRLAGKDLLRRKPDPDAASYWIPRDDRRPDRESLERYF